MDDPVGVKKDKDSRTKVIDFTKELDENDKPIKLVLFGIAMPRYMAYYITSALCFLVLIVSFLVLSFYVEWTAFYWRFFVGFVCFMAFCVVVLEVNHHNKFKFMTAYFHNYRNDLIVLFSVFALIDFILLELSDVEIDKCDYNDPSKNHCPYLNPDEYGIRYITRTLTIFCGFLFSSCIMAFWERVSYFSAHSTWVIAILYMTIIGGIFLYFARCLEPPPRGREKEFNWSWHQRRSTNKILSIIVKLMIIFVLFFVMMGAIAMGMFGEVAHSSKDLGTWNAMIVFIIMSHLISVTPLVPGSIIDVCAGFLFVTLFVNNEGATIELAFIISLLITIALHFSGSCLQYFVGKIPSVQIWANKTLPPELLAASDSVLQTANWFKVGIVGQVFMDTANGLNQGRMNMDFCTQFWSEYASIPNSIGLVLLGTVLALPSFNSKTEPNETDFEWAQDAIPLVIMITTLWNMIGSSWGAKELLQSSGTVQYWTALEKWSTVQYFYKLGYVPTHKGWINDCFELGQTKEKDSAALYDIIGEYRENELGLALKKASKKNYKRLNKKGLCSFCKSLGKRPENPDEQRQIIQEQKTLNIHVAGLREHHWDRLMANNNFAELIEKKYLKKYKKEIFIENYFQNSNHGIQMFIHIFFVLFIFLTGLLSYLWIAFSIELTIAVQEGIHILSSKYTNINGWICLCIFWILIIIYYHREFISFAKNSVSLLKYVFTGCSSTKGLETVFSAPKWDNAPIGWDNSNFDMHGTVSDLNDIDDIDDSDTKILLLHNAEQEHDIQQKDLEDQ